MDVSIIPKEEVEYLGLPCVKVKSSNDMMLVYLEMNEEEMKKGYTPFIIFDNEGISALKDIEQIACDEHGSLEQFTL